MITKISMSRAEAAHELMELARGGYSRKTTEALKLAVRSLVKRHFEFFALNRHILDLSGILRDIIITDNHAKFRANLIGILHLSPQSSAHYIAFRNK